MAHKKLIDFSYLDEHLLKLKEFGATLDFHSLSMESLLSDELLMAISHIGLPKTYNPYEGILNSENFDPDVFPDFLQLIEYISRFDASAMLALPGNSLSCRAVEVLGTESQKELFFSPFLSGPTWTFFAVSEPNVGSDVQQVSTVITKNETGELVLNGHKYFIGGAQKANIGLVFSKQDFHSRLVMVDTSCFTNSLQIEAINPYGLLGTGLSSLKFDNYPIYQEQLLGEMKASFRQGLNAISLVFEKHRPLVAAMALGTAYGLLTYLGGYKIRGLKHYWRQYHSLYSLMLRIGYEFHTGRAKVYHTSLLKVRACRLVENIASRLAELLPREIWLTDHLLQKHYRDAFAFEYMEGTSNIHRLNAYQSFIVSQDLSL